MAGFGFGNMLAGISQGVGGNAQTLYGLWLTKKAKKELKELQGQEKPTFETSPELRKSYEDFGSLSTSGGFTPEESASYRNQINRSNTAAYNKALESGGGGLAGAIGAGMNYGNIGAEQQFFSKNAELARDNKLRGLQGQQTIAGQLQQLRSMQNQSDLNYRLDTEKALGAAIAGGRNMQLQGFNNFMNSFQTFAGSSTPSKQNDLGSQPANSNNTRINQGSDLDTWGQGGGITT